MMNNIKCFLIEPSGIYRRSLRRYNSGYISKLTDEHWIHSTENILDEVESKTVPSTDMLDHDDPRWPKKCSCGYEFQYNDDWQVRCSEIYKTKGSEEKFILNGNLPAGAMYFATWMENEEEHECGDDGRSLCVVLPGGHVWMVDSRASNCTKPEDNVHRCWVRHGTAPDITVDKNGNTCNAGAGSIIIDGWHGFLRNGHLVSC